MPSTQDSQSQTEPLSGSSIVDSLAATIEIIDLSSVAHVAPWVPRILNAQRAHRRWCVKLTRQTVSTPPLSNATKRLRTAESPLGLNDALQPPTNPYGMLNPLRDSSQEKKD
jgi:hypothetical protein